MLTHASLFSGIGGFDLAAEWAGWENIFHCEWNPFGQKVLAHHFPNSKSYNDITKTDFSIHAGTVDVLTGGFPCQPYSSAGKRLGKADERHLFPAMLRAIKEIKPRWVIGENVRGLVSWNGGMVFDEVCNDLEMQGYEVQPFLIPAASVNAPHKRERIWFIAYSHNTRTNQSMRSNGEREKIDQRQEKFTQPEFRQNGSNRTFINSNDKGRCSEFGNVSKENGEISERNENAEFSDTSNGNAPDSRCFNKGSEEKSKWTSNNFAGFSSNENERSKTNGDESGFNTNSNKVGLSTEMANGELAGQIRFVKRDERNQWNSFPTQPALCGGDDGLPKELDGITIPKWRNESIKAYGNAIVPQVAYEIFKAINEFELLLKK